MWGPYLWAMRPWALHCAQFPPSLRQSASPTGQGCGGCRRLERDTESLRKSYQQVDEKTLLQVMTNPNRLLDIDVKP